MCSMWSGSNSPDQSSCSSGTGDVLIRSTRVLLPGPGPGSVQITVQKLQEPPAQQRQQEQQQPRRQPVRSAPVRVPAPPRPERRRPQKPEQTKENREPKRRPAEESRPHHKLRAATHTHQEHGHDLLTSRFAAGGRGVLLAALKQRSHSAPNRREVRVQLLDPGPPLSSSQPAPGSGSSCQPSPGPGSSCQPAPGPGSSCQPAPGPWSNSQPAPGPGSSCQPAPGPGSSSQPAPGPGSSPHLDVGGIQTEAVLSSCCHGDATSKAAAAAAAAAVTAVTAAAPLIKAQSDLQARVCRLADGVEKLLQADREGVARGQSLSEQTLQTLYSHQQQLQSELLQSLSMATGRDPAVTSDPAVTYNHTAAGQPTFLQVTHLEPAGSDLSLQPPSSSPTRAASSAAATQMDTAAMVTHRCDRGAEQTREDLEAPAGSHLESSSNPSKAAARRANEMLKEMGRLRTEMKTLLMPQEPLKTSRPEPDHQLQSRTSKQKQSASRQKPVSSQNQFRASLSKSSQSHQTQTPSGPSDPSLPTPQTQWQQFSFQTIRNQESQSQPKQSKPNQSKPVQSQAQPNKSEPIQSQAQPNQSLSEPIQSQSQPNQSLSKPNQSQSQPSLSRLQPNQSRSRPSTSQHTEPPHSQRTHFQSHQISSQQSHQSGPSMEIQRRPKVPSVLEEAGQVLRQVRRQKKVLEENLEALLRAKTGEVLHCQLEALAANRDWTEEVRIKKTVDAWISTLSKDIQADLSTDVPASCRATETKPAASEVAAGTSQKVAVSSGHRRSMGMLRGTGSKTAAGRGSRGQTAGAVQVTEPQRVTGVLTDRKQVEEDGEAYLAHLYGKAPYEGVRRTLKKSPYLRFTSPASSLSRKPRPRLVESVRGVKVKSCKTQTSLAPPITSSPHYIKPSDHMTSGDPADLTVTSADPVAMAIPLSRPRMDSSSRCVQEVTSLHRTPPTSSVAATEEVSPVQEAEALHDTGEAPPAAPAPPPLPSIDIIERKREDEEEVEEKVFPGAEFLSVADVVQQEVMSVGGEEEVSVGGEEEVQLDGSPSPPPVLYQGPAFPPQAQPPLPGHDLPPILELQRDELETRLLLWVEQQLMSRMISELYRPSPSDPAHNDSTDQSEPEPSVTSDIVEAAGGAGLQLFVDSSVSVDSVLIRQLVNEVLSEQVALLLGTRDTPEPEPEPETVEPREPGAKQEDGLFPLVPTPVPTPPPSPATPNRETPPLTTPPPSEPTSLLGEDSPQPITAPEPVATPTPSPEPARSVGSPINQDPPSLAWGGTELPLEDERAGEQLDTQPQTLQSVAQEEPPLSSPQPPPSPPAPPTTPPVRAASPCSSSDDSSSSDSRSSSTGAGTEVALKHISEGELLVSINQSTAMTEGGAVCSFSSSLQELQEMDFDPPSEGQVRGHELLLTLLTKMEQGVTHRGERPQPEGSWGREEDEEVSVGEVREDWTTNPHRTTNPRSLSHSTAALQGQTCSPGQISADFRFEETNQDVVAMENLMMEPLGTLTSDLQTEASPTPPSHTARLVAPVQVRQLDTQTAEEQEEEGEVQEEQQEQQEQQEEQDECVSAAADSDSSVSDVF